MFPPTVMKFISSKTTNLAGQLSALDALYEDVHCRYSLASCKLSQLLEPFVNGDHSNVAHMQQYLQEFRDTRGGADHQPPPTAGLLQQVPDSERTRILAAYEECMTFQHQLNIVQNVVRRIRAAQRTLDTNNDAQAESAASPTATTMPTFRAASSDKLRVLSECVLDVLMHYVTEYKTQAVNAMHRLFDRPTCERLFEALVVSGEIHQQLSVCALLVQMCAGQEWWGSFMADTFTALFSSQNSEVFPADRVFYLMSYLGRKSMTLPTHRTTSSVIDEILKALAIQLVPLAPPRRRSDDNGDDGNNIFEPFEADRNADHQLISWLLLFLSLCLDDGNAFAHIVPPHSGAAASSSANGGAPTTATTTTAADSSASAGKQRPADANMCNSGGVRWEFMSGEADLTKARAGAHASGSSSRTFSRSFKKRLLQTKSPAAVAASAIVNIAGGGGGKMPLDKSGLDKSVQVAQLTSQIEAALKQQEHLMKKHNVKLQQLQSCLDKARFKMNAGKSTAAVIGNGSHTSSTPSETLAGCGGAEALADEADVAAMQASMAERTEQELVFERTVRTMKLANAVLVIRGLIGLLLNMNYTCNMDMFLMTCKVCVHTFVIMAGL